MAVTHLPDAAPARSPAVKLRRQQGLRALGATLITLAVLWTAAPAAHGAEGWTRAQSHHFTVYTDAGKTAAQQAALNLEALRGFLVEIAPAGRFDAEVPFHVYLFRDADQLGALMDSSEMGSSGVLVTTDEGVYGATVWAERGGAARFVNKQYLAWVLKENLPELPVWFHRGLTDFYSTFEIVDGEAHVGKVVPQHLMALRRRALNRRHREELLAAEKAKERTPETGPGGSHAKGEELRPEATSEDQDGDDGDELIPHLVFSETGAGPALDNLTAVRPADWVLVHYLLLGSDQLRPKVRPYLSAVTAGADPDTAFTDIFGTPREEIAYPLEDYVVQDKHRFLRVPLTGEGPQEVSVQPMPMADVEYRLGALRLRTAPAGNVAGMADAEGRFRRALAAEPEHGLARAGLAELAMRRGDLEAAISGYEAAVATRPDDATLRYRLGEARLAALGGRRPSDAAAEAHLEAAVRDLSRTTELAPDFPAGWELLGYALTLAPEPSQRAVSALERAAELRPGRVDVVSNLLLARARVGDRDGVGRAMEKLRQLGADPSVLARGRQTELRLMLYQGQALVRAERLDDAVAVFAQVMAEADDPALADAAARQLEFVAKVTQRNLYASLYQKAEAQIDAFHPEAAASVEELLALAKPGLQREAAEALAERLRRRSLE